jgi:hypothetical protein
MLESQGMREEVMRGARGKSSGNTFGYGEAGPPG